MMKKLLCFMLLFNHVDAKIGVRSRPITTGSKIYRLKQLCYLYNQPSVEFCEKNYPEKDKLPPDPFEYRVSEVATVIVMLMMLVFTLLG